MRCASTPHPRKWCRRLVFHQPEVTSFYFVEGLTSTGPFSLVWRGLPSTQDHDPRDVFQFMRGLRHKSIRWTGACVKQFGLHITHFYATVGGHLRLRIYEPIASKAWLSFPSAHQTLGLRPSSFCSLLLARVYTLPARSFPSCQASFRFAVHRNQRTEIESGDRKWGCRRFFPFAPNREASPSPLIQIIR